MPDVFDFITTRTEVPDISPINTKELPTLSLIPQVSADLRVDPSLDVQTKVQDKTKSILDLAAQNISSSPDNAPAYDYTTQQEKRYNNPNLQFTPYTNTGKDIEDLYASKQSAGSQLWNSTLKAGANVVGTFASSFLSIPQTLDLVRSGKAVQAFSDDSMFGGIQNWLTGLEDTLPNYYTEWEREHPYASAIMPTGAANFWGDKVIKNIGFSIGALGAGVVQDALIELASGGAATPATFVALAGQLGKFKSSLFRGFRNLSKVAQTAEGMNDIIGAAKVANNLEKGIEAASLYQKISKGSKFAATTYLSAQGEAFIEGYNTYLDTKKQLLQEAINQGKTDSTTLSEIEKKAQDAGRITTGLNIPLLMASNFIQFPTLLGGRAAFGSIPENFIKKELTADGLKLVNNQTFKRSLSEWTKESLKDASSEGFEEGAQHFISNSLHDYYVDKLNPESKKGIFSYMINNVPSTLQDKGFWEETFLGALSGFVMGAPAAAPHYFNKSKTQRTVDHINSVYERFNQSVKQFTHNTELTTINDPSDQKEIAYKNLYSTVHDSLKVGTYESFQDSLEDLKGVDLNSYNQTFGTEFKDDSEKLAHIQNIIEESKNIEEDVARTNRFFPDNPYRSNSRLVQRIKDAFSPKNDLDIKNIQEKLFEDFKEVVGYNQAKLRVTKASIEDVTRNLKSLGTKDESIEYLANLRTDPKGLKNYKSWKKAQLTALEKSEQYYDTMAKQPVTVDNQNADLTQQLRKEREEVKRSVSKLREYIKRLDAISEGDKYKVNQDEILVHILSEETNEDQLKRFADERKKRVEELQKEKEKEAAFTKEEDDLMNDPNNSKTAEKIIDLNEQAEEEAAPIDNTVITPTPVQKSNAWMSGYEDGSIIKVGAGSYTIVLQDETNGIIIGRDPKGNLHEIRMVNGHLTSKNISPTATPSEQIEEAVPVTPVTTDPVDVSKSEEQKEIDKALDLTLIIQDFKEERQRILKGISKHGNSDDRTLKLKAIDSAIQLLESSNSFEEAFKKNVFEENPTKLERNSSPELIKKSDDWNKFQNERQRQFDMVWAEVNEIKYKYKEKNAKSEIDPVDVLEPEKITVEPSTSPIPTSPTLSNTTFTYDEIASNPGFYFTLTDSNSSLDNFFAYAQTTNSKGQSQVSKFKIDKGVIGDPRIISEDQLAKLKTRTFVQVIFQGGQEIVKPEVVVEPELDLFRDNNKVNPKILEIRDIYTSGKQFFNIDATGLEVAESLPSNITEEDINFIRNEFGGKLLDWFERGLKYLEETNSNKLVSSKTNTDKFLGNYQNNMIKNLLNYQIEKGNITIDC